MLLCGQRIHDQRLVAFPGSTTFHNIIIQGESKEQLICHSLYMQLCWCLTNIITKREPHWQFFPMQGCGSTVSPAAAWLYQIYTSTLKTKLTHWRSSFFFFFFFAQLVISNSPQDESVCKLLNLIFRLHIVNNCGLHSEVSYRQIHEQFSSYVVFKAQPLSVVQDFVWNRFLPVAQGL